MNVGKDRKVVKKKLSTEYREKSVWEIVLNGTFRAELVEPHIEHLVNYLKIVKQ